MMHMANYWDNIDEGKEIGKEIGIEIGKEIGIERGSAISLINFVEKYMNRHNSSLENTLQILDVSMEDYLKAKEIVEREELFV